MRVKLAELCLFVLFFSVVSYPIFFSLRGHRRLALLVLRMPSTCTTLLLVCPVVFFLFSAMVPILKVSTTD